MKGFASFCLVFGFLILCCLGAGIFVNMLIEEPKDVPENVQQKKLIAGTRVDPQCPSSMRTDAKIEATLVIGRDGKVEKVLIRNDVHPLVDRAIRKALLQWQYEPTHINNNSKEGLTEVRTKVHIRLKC
jgi:hypothetical protein